jgi:hypothetical protein
MDIPAGHAFVRAERRSFGRPLVCGGLAKAVYDLPMLVQFQSVPAREKT